MEMILVDKTVLLGALQANKAQHRAQFEEAQVTFRALVIEKLDEYRAECERVLDERMRQAREGGVVTLRFALPSLVRVPEPVDYTKDYDRAIRMLEWEEREKVEISEADFRSYVDNDWGWMADFAANTIGYTAAGRP